MGTPRVEGVAGLLVDKIKPCGWYFEEHLIDSDHVAAVAWRHLQNGSAPPVHAFQTVVLEDFICKEDAFNVSVADSEWDLFSSRDALPTWLSNKSKSDV